MDDGIGNWRNSANFSAAEKIALEYCELMATRHDQVDDAFYARLREHYDEEEIVELGAFVAITYGQQRVIKTWAVGHEELPAEGRGGLRAAAP